MHVGQLGQQLILRRERDALRADDWKDVFVAWAPSKNLSLTLAYVQLGRVVPGITDNRKQSGAYLSAQVAF